MSLRRTALQRRTPLARTPMPARARELKARAPKRAKAARQTGPGVGTRTLVAARAGWACELCGVRLYTIENGWLAAHSFHHRRPRGMGGTRRDDANSPANLLLVCGTGTTGCHWRIEAHRATALADGHLVGQADDPAAVPAALFAGRVTLTHDGTYLEAA